MLFYKAISYVLLCTSHNPVLALFKTEQSFFRILLFFIFTIISVQILIVIARAARKTRPRSRLSQNNGSKKVKNKEHLEARGSRLTRASHYMGSRN